MILNILNRSVKIFLILLILKTRGEDKMKYFKKMSLISSLVISFLLAGCNQSDPAATVEVEKVTPVKVGEVTTGNLSVEETTIGKVAATNSVDVVPSLAGELTAVKIKKGMAVKKGDVLAQLDKNDLQTALEMEQVAYRQAKSQLETANISKSQAENAVQNAHISLKQAQLNLQKAKEGQSTGVTNSDIGLNQAELGYNQAKANFDRTKILFESGIVSKSAYEDAENAMKKAKLTFDQAKESAQTAGKTTDIELMNQQVDQAKVAMRNAEQQLKLAKVGINQAQIAIDSAALRVKKAKDQVADATIVAPVSGEVTTVNGEVGEMISSSAPFVTIVTIDSVKIKASISAEQLATFKIGQTIQVDIPALNQTITAKMSYISSVANDAGFYDIEATVPNDDKALKPGMLAKLIQRTDVVKATLLIPTAAIVEKAGEVFVYVIEDNHAVRKPIKVIKSQTEVSAITSKDLKAGAQIVVKGQTTLSDGNKVSIVEEGR